MKKLLAGIEEWHWMGLLAAVLLLMIIAGTCEGFLK